MRKIIVSEFLTLDGVMEAPYLWSFDFACAEQNEFKFAELFASDALLLGRVTYDGFAAAWPTMPDTGEYGERMNSLPKYVFSTTLQEGSWNNTTVLTGELAQEIATLKQQPGQDILVFGSGNLVQQLHQQHLIDEYRLMIYPVTVGKGKRLFDPESEKHTLKLVESKVFSPGTIVLTYVPNHAQ